MQWAEWMREKKKKASENSYRDANNASALLLKHEAFEAEVKANTDRLNSLNEVLFSLEDENVTANDFFYRLKIIPFFFFFFFFFFQNGF